MTVVCLLSRFQSFPCVLSENRVFPKGLESPIVAPLLSGACEVSEVEVHVGLVLVLKYIICSIRF